jgi:hypothetical protein
MATKALKNYSKWKVGFLWVLADIVGVFVGASVGAILNDNLWPHLEWPPGTICILSPISNPVERLLIIGMSIGCFVGITEWSILRRRWLYSGWWIIASTVGWALGLAIGVYVEVIITEQIFEGALGGTIIGLVQWAILRQNIVKAHWWILARAVSGIIALGWIAVNLSVFDILHYPLQFVLVGLVTGTITGITLVWLLRPSASDTEIPLQAALRA